MVSLEQLAGERVRASWPLLRADRAVSHLPPLRLDAAQSAALCCGQVIALPQAARRAGACTMPTAASSGSA